MLTTRTSAALSLLVLAACSAQPAGEVPSGDPPKEPPANTPPSPNTPAPSSDGFCVLRETVLQSKCIRCHGDGGVHPDFSREDMAQVLPNLASAYYPEQTLVIPGAPQDSLLYQKLINAQPQGAGSAMPPAGETALTETETKLIHDWIASGASAGAGCEPSPKPSCEEEVLYPSLLQLRRLSAAQLQESLRDLLHFPGATLDLPEEDGLVPSALFVDKLNRGLEQLFEAQEEWQAPLHSCDPVLLSQAECLTQFIDVFAARAFRRAVTVQERTWLEQSYSSARGALSHEASLDVIAQVILQSPQFLYVLEEGVAQTELPEGVVRLSGAERAARLSFFLWNTIPDEELMAAAELGELDSPEGMRAAARSMLRSPKARHLIRVFFSEYLQLDGSERHQPLEGSTKDSELFPEFEQALALDIRRETEALVDRVVFDQNASLKTLITTNEAYLNGKLAELYGVSLPSSEAVQTVDLLAEPARWLDTAPRNSMVEAPELFDASTARIQTSDPQVNIHSHHTGSETLVDRDFVFRGRMQGSDASSGFGVTFLSDYPNTDTYYRLRRNANSDTNPFVLASHGGAGCDGVNSTFVPIAGAFTLFEIVVRFAENRTMIDAFLWREGDARPGQPQLSCVDDGANRLTIGRIGLWSHGPGTKTWDRLELQLGQDARDAFQWVELPAQTRSGVFTRASFLASRANSKFPSPILRGAYLLNDVLCAETGDPPADANDAPVEAIGSNENGMEVIRSIRESTELRTQGSDCAYCHRQINPLGHALGNYDALGRFSELEHVLRPDGTTTTVEVDAEVILVGAQLSGPVSGPVELSERLGASRAVYDCFTEKVWRFALNRAPRAEEHCALRELQERFFNRDNILDLIADFAATDAFGFAAIPQE